MITYLPPLISTTRKSCIHLMSFKSKMADLYFYEELCRTLGQGPALQWLLSQYANSLESSPARSPARSPDRSPVRSPIMSPNKSPILSPRNNHPKESSAPPPKKYSVPKGGSVRSRYSFSETDTNPAFGPEGHLEKEKQWTSLDASSMNRVWNENTTSCNPCDVNA